MQMKNIPYISLYRSSGNTYDRFAMMLLGIEYYYLADYNSKENQRVYWVTIDNLFLLYYNHSEQNTGQIKTFDGICLIIFF